jgi:antitoxin component HigA of HigAB toxin-antitoxin module
MFAKINQAISGIFTTTSPTTGATVDADGAPTVAAYRNGTLDAGFVVTVAQVGIAGVYRFSGSVPNTYTQPDCVEFVAAATVGGISSRASVGRLQVVSRLASELPLATEIRSDLDASSTKLANLDATVSSRLAASSYTAPTAAPTAAQIRAEMDSSSTKLANLDATISSRLPHAGYTTPPTAAAIRSEMDNGSTKLARLDVVLSTRLAASDYTAPTAAPTAAQIRAEMDSSSTKLANLDATVSSRLAASNYNAAPTAAAVAAAVDSTLTAAHGLGSWQAGETAGLTGPRAITLRFQDANGDPVPSVDFVVSGVGVGRSGADGVAEFGIVDGSFEVIARPTGGTLFEPAALVVSGEDLEQIVAGTTRIIPMPATPGTCKVSGQLVTIDGKPAAGAKVQFELHPQKAIGGEQLVHGRRVIATADGNGFLEIDLLRNDVLETPGTFYRVRSEGAVLAGERVEFLSPTFDLAQLANAPA